MGMEAGIWRKQGEEEKKRGLEIGRKKGGERFF